MSPQARAVVTGISVGVKGGGQVIRISKRIIAGAGKEDNGAGRKDCGNGGQIKEYMGGKKEWEN